MENLELDEEVLEALGQLQFFLANLWDREVSVNEAILWLLEKSEAE